MILKALSLYIMLILTIIYLSIFEKNRHFKLSKMIYLKLKIHEDKSNTSFA